MKRKKNYGRYDAGRSRNNTNLTQIQYRKEKYYPDPGGDGASSYLFNSRVNKI